MWFETVAEAQRRAERRLPKSVYSALLAGAERADASDNVAAFRELASPARRRPVRGARPGDDGDGPDDLAAGADLADRRTGGPPRRRGGRRPRGRRAGTAIGLSSFASKPLEEVVAANPQTFFQIYWMGVRDRSRARLERARAAGATGSSSRSTGRSRTGATGAARRSPTASTSRRCCASRPRCSSGRAGSSTSRAPAARRTDVPNMAAAGEAAPAFFGAYGEWMMTPPPSWDDLAWLREQWDGPFMIKGVMRLDDARRAVDAGVERDLGLEPRRQQPRRHPRLDPRAPGVADAVGDQVEVLLDGGIRRAATSSRRSRSARAR